jgi:hypothetical protein
VCLTKHHATKKYGGVEVYFHSFLTEVSGQLRATAALPPEKEPSAPWVGPRTDLDAVDKRKIHAKPYHAACSLVTVLPSSYPSWLRTLRIVDDKQKKKNVNIFVM